MQIKFTLLATIFAGLGSASALHRRDAWLEQVLSAHNNARAKYSASNLTWDADLYSSALPASQTCTFQHSEGSYGENLYVSMSPKTSIDDIVKSWIEEAAKYDYNTPAFSTETGNFTQVVWKSTTSVACAIANCPGGSINSRPTKYAICRYAPAGNIDGQFSENVGQFQNQTTPLES